MVKVTKVLICGSRNWDNPEIIHKWIEILKTHGVKTIVEGGASGADSMAKRSAEELGLEVIEIEAEWKKHGRSAGPRRNQLMLRRKPGLVIAFCYNIEPSIGTKNMVQLAESAKVPVIRIGYGSFFTDPGNVKLFNKIMGVQK